MKTEVIMKRDLFGKEIRQKSKSEYFSATDLVNAGNKYRIENDMSLFNLSSYLNKKATKEFIAELSKEYGDIVIKSRGRNASTWVHPFLFLDVALSISPKLKINVYKWLYDYLIKYRNTSGDSYKKMAGSIYLNSQNKKNFPATISNIAKRIQKECRVLNWEEATEKQLGLRNKIHNNISLLADIIKNNDVLIETAIKKAKETI